MTLSNKIRIAFYKGPVNWRTRIVMWWTGSEYTHAELVLPSGDSLGICPDDAGTARLRKINFRDDHWDFIEIDITKRQLHDIINFFTETHGCRYDWIGMILSHLFPFYLKRDNKWYCSQWIACALTISNVMSFMYNKITPGKLYDILSVRINNNLLPGRVDE